LDNAIQTEDEDNIENPEDNEFRVLGLPEIDPQLNVLNVNGDDNNIGDNNIRLIKLPPLVSEETLSNIVGSLNLKQKTYLTHVMHNAKIKSVYHEFVGGGAGVGKSRLISAIFQSLSDMYNRKAGAVHGPNNDNDKYILLCAPTGKAAFGISGSTLHSMFSLPVNQSRSHLRPLSHDLVNTLHSNLIDLKLIIIDEISMVSSLMFSHLDSRLKQIFKNSAPFGNISVIVFGDLRQLRPVGGRWIFEPNTTDPYFAIFGSSLWDLFKYFELTEIMRQRDDQLFASALNNMASGLMTADDIQLIRSRICQPSDVPDDAIHLFTSNNEVDHFNTTKLNLIPTEQFYSTAEDFIKAVHLSAAQRNNILVGIRSFKTSETQGLCMSLLLKTTAKYMMTVNVDTGDGLVNGASGILMQIDFDTSNTPTILWIKFSEETVGEIARSKRAHRSEPLWTPIQKLVRSFHYKNNEQVTIDRRQFPVVPAEGITIHKSQGATYGKVVVHTSSRMERASIYVACSRATTASGLFIIGNFNPPKPPQENDKVKTQLENLRTAKLLRTHYDHLVSSSALDIFFHNTQSLKEHRAVYETPCHC